MAKRKTERRWVWVRTLNDGEKAAIGLRCQRFIAEELKPRFLPTIRPTEFNYGIDIGGKWRGSRHTFYTRMRSEFPENRGEEHNSPFARLDHCEEISDRQVFDIMWRRHTGQWFRLYHAEPLERALSLLASDGLLHPIV